MAVGSGQAGVTREQRCAQGFGQDNVGCVVGGEGVTVTPDARQQGGVPIASDRKGLQEQHSLLSSARLDCAHPYQSPERMDNFEID